DDSLLDFIDYLLEWSRQHPIFVCTLARPEIHERRPTWGAGQRSFTSLYLEPLSHQAMEQLLGGLVPGLPDELRAKILERAERVPLYAVETVRMMLDRGALVQDGPVYRPAVQDLLRHVAYETLSRAERKSRHLAAADHLESAFPEEEEVVEVLASHYLDAYREAPDAPDAAEIKARAREMLARAGDRAASLAAAREAQRYYQQAAELADDPLVCADLEDRAGRMAWRRGRADEARELFGKALEIFAEQGLKRPAARSTSLLAEIDFRDGHTSESVARLEHALESLTGEEPDADVAAVAAQ